MVRIALEGNLGAAKSTVLAACAVRLPEIPQYPEPVSEWEASGILGLYYANPAKYGLSFSLEVLLSHRRARAHPTCLMERSCLSNMHVFTKMLHNDNKLTHAEWELFKQYHGILGWAPDVILYLDVPTHVCLERMQARGRECEVAHVDIEVLRRISFQYETLLKYVGDDVRVIRIDGNRPLDEVVEDVVSHVRRLV